MRRIVAVVACLVAILGLLAPVAFAQAPTPKVTINGLFDQITSGGSNIYDGNSSRTGDREWYARTRFRPDFTFEVGRTKAVLGLEFDIDYGQNGNCGAGPGKATAANITGASCAGQGKAGSTAAAGLNTDVAGIVEVKWMYTEFDLTGKDALMPFIPVRTVARAGLQPFGTYGGLVGPYRASYAQGDFAGFEALTTWAPNLTTGLAFVMVEDQLGGYSRSGVVAGTAGKPTHGDDFAFIFEPTFTPFKGLDLKPMYSYARFEGTTSSQARRNATNITTTGTFGAFTSATAGGGVAGAPSYQNGVGAGGVARYANGDPSNSESRHTIGLDGRYRAGPFSLDPTIFYQFGTRNDVVYDNPGTGGSYRAHSVEADMSSWLVDIQGGFQLGPLLLEARAIYSTGNKARDNIGRSIRYFEPLDVDTGYYAGWANILALGIDYFNGNGAQNGGMDTNIGYDRYGRGQFGVRATYSLTPALSLYTVISPTWTAEKVDTDTNINAAGLRVCATKSDIGTQCFMKGDHSYIGTEADLGTTWRFAPNTAFDLVGAYLFAGPALDTRRCGTTGCFSERAHDGWDIAARVRMSF
jgi:hypothetical protein